MCPHDCLIVTHLYYPEEKAFSKAIFKFVRCLKIKRIGSICRIIQDSWYFRLRTD